MYLHMNSNGGVSLGGSLGGLFGFGDSFDLGSNHLYFPRERSQIVSTRSRAEYEEILRREDTKDGLKLAIYGAGCVGLAITAKNLEDTGARITTATSAAVCGVYALSAGYGIYQRHQRHKEYLKALEIESQKKQETQTT